MVDLHRHDEFSLFDGFGKAKELAELAKELGHTSLGTSNHGNTNGIVQTYLACKEVGIKPILGVEGYFLPTYKEKTRGYHLCLFAKNLKGYSNINKIQYEGEKIKYYNPIWTFEILKKYNEGVICTSACIAGYLSQSIISERYDKAEKFIKCMKSIFKDDFYIEIQPYKVSEKGLQEKVNKSLIYLAKKCNVKCILTSDSHRGRKEDFDTYIKMHEIANHNFSDLKSTYEERYMPTEEELYKRFVSMHKCDFDKRKEESLSKCLEFGRKMLKNLKEIEDKVEDNILDKLELELPKVSNDSFEIIKRKVKEGLIKRNKYTKKYFERCKKELEVIKYHNFSDYFLIVADYVNWAKNKGIAVGPGRGSVCNCLVAYALGITDVDSLYFNLDFRRFLRKDKKKFPDIDLDFETVRRQEVIQYIVNKYKGKAARICSYGLYKVDNLINDLAKVCGLNTITEKDEEKKQHYKRIIDNIKKIVNDYIEDGRLNDKLLLSNNEVIKLNEKYDNIFIHFVKLFKKVRFIGTHAAGVAITKKNLLDYTAFRLDSDGNIFTNYDLADLEMINVLKFDILGLKTMESIRELREATGNKCDYESMINDKKIMNSFKIGNCDGVFQFEKKAARKILEDIECDCFEDVVAASSMNRPGPLSLGMPQQYAENKFNLDEAKTSKYWEYTKDSYGTIIYQEQIQQICINIANMTWEEADKMMKMLKGTSMTEKALKVAEENKKMLFKSFIKGASSNGFNRKEAKELFDKMLVYSFNKGHAVGYSLISLEEMFYKIYYPNEYWFSKLKFAKSENEYNMFCSKAVKDGSIIFLPHVNYSLEKTSLSKYENESCLQQGLSEIKNVGLKAAEEIVKERETNGNFKNYKDLVSRIPKRILNNRVLNALENAGALEFKKNKYLSRVELYNKALYGRG